MKPYQTTWLDHKITIRTEGIADRSDGAVWLDMDGTIVLATTIVDTSKTQILDFTPLSVHYFEKAYAINKIPGGFSKREGKPQDHEVRIARLIDRAIRPLMPDGLCNEVQIIVNVIGYDGKIDPTIPSFLAAFLSLRLSGLPLKTEENMCGIQINGLFFAVTPTKIVMMEGEGEEISHTQIYQSAKTAINSCKPLFECMHQLVKKQKKCPINLMQPDPMCRKAVLELSKDFKKILTTPKKRERTHKTQQLYQKIMARLNTSFEEGIIKKTFYDCLAEHMITQLAETETRVDGRKNTDIRPIKIETGVLPHAHGSALFTRGDTQVLGVLTVAGSDKKQYIDSLQGHTENLLFHYNFPPFSVGDADRIGAPTRREIGHGYIGYRAIKNVLPYNPNYTYRLVAEILSCNGSSSMASVCAASLALKTAGIEMNGLVAGIGLGYVRINGKDIILTDILGDEDHLGLMDMKLAGTKKGITAVQMDVKVPGISLSVLSKALTQGRKALTKVLLVMTTHIVTQKHLNQTVPKIESLDINRDAVYQIIGKGGSHIKELIKDHNVKVDVRDSGLVTITGQDWKDIYAVKKIIRQKTDPIQKGQEFICEIIRIDAQRIQVRLNRHLKGYVKFKNKKDKEAFLEKNPVNSQIRLQYTGIDRFGDVILGNRNNG